ncbi:MAG: sugar ABC transporter substrate-binding protein [Anaerocolumna aminovalerica]|jgi:multiple sugar transport system substrate-binding protein|uniref:ABC transporter substrate-binding protein n=1 Tax=Anaerocolumna aminovalerica TaxID=1527 RepID=UPI00248BF5DC|nr:sugar ABC transporter substrate-binding protein [Anaerocolumna aminovalerica]MDU6263815.1 sugar ABC transporter substrate-binding protein [Anaerocolumna aminovalerica]
MKKKKVFVLLCVALLSITVLAGCSSANKKEGTTETTNKQGTKTNSDIRFMWWGGETRHKATVDALELYKGINPDITVKTEYSGWDGYFDKLTTQLAASTGPDIVQLSYTNVSEYVARKQLVPLDEYIEKGIIDVSKLSEATLDMYRIDGKLYAIPAGVSTSLLFYNKDYFDQAGVEYPTDSWTWEDYMKAAKELTMDTDGDGKIDVWGTAYMEDPAGADLTFKKYVYERGGKLWSDDLKSVKFNSPEGLAAVEFIKKPLDESIMPPMEITASNPQNVDDFQTKRVAMIIHYSPITQAYMSAGLNFGIERTPKGMEKEAFWINPSMVYSITKDSKSPEASAELINFLVNNEEAGDILALERGVPSNGLIRSRLVNTLSDAEIKMFECIEKSTSDDISNEPFPAGYMEIHALFKREFENMMYGKYTSQEFLDVVEAECNKILQKFYE